MGDPYKDGLEDIRTGRFFEAHEQLELVWRAAPAEERDFYQGLVHVAVAWYQAGRGRPVATASQLSKAANRRSAFSSCRSVATGLPRPAWYHATATWTRPW